MVEELVCWLALVLASLLVCVLEVELVPVLVLQWVVVLDMASMDNVVANMALDILDILDILDGNAAVYSKSNPHSAVYLY